MNLDLKKYGLIGDSKNSYSVRKIAAYDGQQSEFLGTYLDRDVKINLSMQGRDIVLLEIKQID